MELGAAVQTSWSPRKHRTFTTKLLALFHARSMACQNMTYVEVRNVQVAKPLAAPLISNLRCVMRRAELS
jgi:hypothetical protein